MASINGITVKGLQKFYGHEGEILCQGNLYVGNKKVGYWSQGDWGGPDRFDFDSAYSEEKLQERVKELNKDKAQHGETRNGKPYTIEYDLELLLYDFLKLREEEKTFRDSVKKGNAGIMIATDGYHVVTWNLKKAHTDMTNEELIQRCSKMIEDAKREAKFYGNKEHVVNIYRDLKDFCIGEPIALSEIAKVPSLDEKVSGATGKGSKEISKKIDRKIER